MRIRMISAALLCACCGCFPTFQAARVEPGFHVDAAVIALADQPRNGVPQKPDYIATITPAYGFGRRLELGLPIGVYAADGVYDRCGPYSCPPGQAPTRVTLHDLFVGARIGVVK